MSLAPLVIWTESGFHSVNALIGPADQLRQELQWQNPMATGWPVTVSSTAPQKQLPLYIVSLLIWNLPVVAVASHGPTLPATWQLACQRNLVKRCARGAPR